MILDKVLYRACTRCSRQGQVMHYDWYDGHTCSVVEAHQETVCFLAVPLISPILLSNLVGQCIVRTRTDPRKPELSQKLSLLSVPSWGSP